MEFISKSHFSEVEDKHAEMLSTGALSDVVIVAGGHRFKCHKVILSAACPYFYAMFNSGMREANQDEIIIHSLQDIDKLAVENILKFIYTGKIVLKQQDGTSMIYAADMLGLDALKVKAAEVCGQTIGQDNCFKVMSTANQLGLKHLMEKFTSFIVEHFDEMCKHKEFMTIPFEQIISILGNPKLKVKIEDQVGEYALKWLNNGDNRMHVKEVLFAIHLNNLSCDFMKTRLLTDQIIKQSDYYKLMEEVASHIEFQTEYPVELPILPSRLYTDQCEAIFIAGFDRKFATLIPNEDCVESYKFLTYPLKKSRPDNLETRCCSIDNTVYFSELRDNEEKIYEYNIISRKIDSSKSFNIPRVAHNFVAGSHRKLYTVGGCMPSRYVQNYHSHMELPHIKQIEELDLDTGNCKVIGELAQTLFKVHTSYFYNGYLIILGLGGGDKNSLSNISEIHVFEIKTKKRSVLGLHFPEGIISLRLSCITKYRNKLIGFTDSPGADFIHRHYLKFIINLDSLIQAFLNGTDGNTYTLVTTISPDNHFDELEVVGHLAVGFKYRQDGLEEEEDDMEVQYTPVHSLLEDSHIKWKQLSLKGEMEKALNVRIIQKSCVVKMNRNC